MIVDVMVDLETLGTAPGSVVLSIGAAASDAATFFKPLEVCSSLYAGLTVDPSTMNWWRQQSVAVWEAQQRDCLPLRAGLQLFSSWLQTRRETETDVGNKLRIWGDAASFDLTLLACAYRAANLPVPWSYREEYCYRTLRNIKNSEKPVANKQHDALSDAKAQLAHLKELLG